MTNAMLRRAVIGDLDALVALEAQFSSDRIARRSFRHLLTRAHADIWVWVEHGRPVGDVVVLYRARSRRARVYSVVTHPDFRGRGIGTRLLRAAERGAAARGCRRIDLEVRADDADTIGWYLRHNYGARARVEAFYEDHGAALRMDKALVPLIGRGIRHRAAVAAAASR